ncbi:hypothetical protein FHG87_006074 [Trinorchestia longiramus]|nr:hypothetical protein FHG87_006074 [Trinorchestia longiramus]
MKDDFKASGIESSKHTISRALRREGLRSRTAGARGEHQKRHIKAMLKHRVLQHSTSAFYVRLRKCAGELREFSGGYIVRESTSSSCKGGERVRRECERLYPRARAIKANRNTQRNINKISSVSKSERRLSVEICRTSASKPLRSKLGVVSFEKHIQCEKEC